jgi:hypothetical protein
MSSTGAASQLTLTQEERQRITSWVQKFKVHRPFQQNATTQADISLVLAQQKPEENPLNEFFTLNLTHVTNLKALEQRVVNDQNESNASVPP